MTFINYVVQPGDSLWKIAKRFDTTVEELARMNGIIEPDKIYPRQVLRIMIEEKPNGEEYVEYIVQEGDTLYMIAQRFNTTVTSLINHNAIANPDRIYPGDRIVIV